MNTGYLLTAIMWNFLPFAIALMRGHPSRIAILILCMGINTVLVMFSTANRLTLFNLLIILMASIGMLLWAFVEEKGTQS